MAICGFEIHRVSTRASGGRINESKARGNIPTPASLISDQREMVMLRDGHDEPGVGDDGAQAVGDREGMAAEGL